MKLGVDKLAKEKMDFYYEQGKKFLNSSKDYPKNVKKHWQNMQRE